MISTDSTISRPESAVAQRVCAYAREWGKLDVIVFSKRTQACTEVSLNADVRVYPTASYSPLLYGWDALWLMRKLERPDVITVQDPFETGLLAWIMAIVYRVPLHVQVHTDFTASAYAHHSLINRMRSYGAWFILKRATRIRVILSRTRDALVKAGVSAPISIHPIYVDRDKFALLKKKRHARFDVALLFVGRLEKEKRVDRAIDALRIARAAGHSVGLTIVGDGSLRIELERLVHQYSLGAYVDFVGWRDDIIPYAETADIVLVPSEYEGYGMVIVEALNAGIPVLATDVGVAREAGAMVVAPNEFSHALVKWIQGGERTAELKGYSYKDNEEYVHTIAEDVIACVRNHEN